MAGKMRRRAERFGLATMALLGILVLGADLLDLLDRLSPDGTIPKITLLILSTVTLFLLLEMERFQTLDSIQARLAELDIEGIAQRLKRDRYAGLVRVHERFAEEAFVRHVATAKRVTILNTWIPNLHQLEDALAAAVARKAEVRILLLNPNSDVADLRDEALRAHGFTEFDGRIKEPDENVKDGVARCVKILARVAKQAGKRRESCLQVRVYNSLPSIAVYRADGHYFISMFLHGQLAIDSPQFEIDGVDTSLAHTVQRELDTLWGIGEPVDLSDPRALDLIRG
jgi:hypothetical protein